MLFSVFQNSSRAVRLLESRWAPTLYTRLRKSALFCSVTSTTEPIHLNEESQAAFYKSADSIDGALLQLLTSNGLINGLAMLTGQRPVAFHPDRTVFDSNAFFRAAL